MSRHMDPSVLARKRRRGAIEKKRRDKINKSLCELKRLVPAANDKQGSAKLEKAEILQLTVDFIKDLTRRGLASSYVAPESSQAGSPPATLHTTSSNSTTSSNGSSLDSSATISSTIQSPVSQHKQETSSGEISGIDFNSVDTLGSSATRASSAIGQFQQQQQQQQAQQHHQLQAQQQHQQHTSQQMSHSLQAAAHYGQHAPSVSGVPVSAVSSLTHAHPASAYDVAGCRGATYHFYNQHPMSASYHHHLTNPLTSDLTGVMTHANGALHNIDRMTHGEMQQSQHFHYIQ